MTLANLAKPFNFIAPQRGLPDGDVVEKALHISLPSQAPFDEGSSNIETDFPQTADN